MPPIFVSPLPDQAIGPGISVDVQLDITLFADGDDAWVTLYTPGETARQIGFGSAQNLHSPSTQIVMGRTTLDSSVFWQFDPQFPQVTHGQPLRAQLTHRTRGGLTIKDTTDQTNVYDVITGQYVAMPHAITTTASGGFTAADRAELQVVKQSVTWDFGNGLLHGIGELLTNLPPSLFGKTAITPDRTGSGSLTNTVGPIVTAASGIAWQVITRAPGLGIDEGAPDRGDIKWLELRAVQRLADNTEYTGEHLESSELVGAWIWGFAPPYRIDYWIVPGVVMRFYWLNVGFPPNWQTDEPIPRQIMRDWRP